MTLEIKKQCKYEGSLFGIEYCVDFKTDDEFIAWFVGLLKHKNPLLGKILDAVLNESPEFVAVKEIKK